MTSPIVLSALEQVAVCLGKQFGNNCEVVIHELERDKFSSRIVRIVNGHVSQRKKGDGPSNIVLEALKKDPSTLKDKVGYLTKTHDGRILKSSTIFIRNETGEVTAVLAINYDITGLLAVQGTLNSIVTVEDDVSRKEPTEIPLNVNELLENLIQQSIQLVGKPVALMTKDEKIKAIQFLNNSGAFLVTKSGDKISREFGISKYTMYSYIDANKSN
ncbi:MAG: helix-turn-helix transcriptional regulator [Treponema sp.]|jgi:predicted transcriptional regulator YheO|nr:helix-turn-helix transcriptional regulator [Treponema sp.]